MTSTNKKGHLPAYYIILMYFVVILESHSLKPTVFSSCMDQQVARDDSLNQLFQLLVRDYGVRPFGRVRQYPATSCQQVQDAQIFQSGEYWISSNGEEPRKIYCEF